jgi:hypothetical protein
VNELPEICGRRMLGSIVEQEHRCKVLIGMEQEKVSPDNALIAVLCEAVRLGREYTDFVGGKVPYARCGLPLSEAVDCMDERCAYRGNCGKPAPPAPAAASSEKGVGK